jgi:hypothetical protein
MKVSEVKTAEPFKSLFPITLAVLGKIQQNMQDKGFDRSRPITIWSGKRVVVDGHARLQAAKNLGLEEVPAVEIEFESEAAALEYATYNQINRRNMGERDLRDCMEVTEIWLDESGNRQSVQIQCAMCQYLGSSRGRCQAKNPAWGERFRKNRFVFHTCPSFNRVNLESPLG